MITRGEPVVSQDLGDRPVGAASPTLPRPPSPHTPQNLLCQQLGLVAFVAWNPGLPAPTWIFMEPSAEWHWEEVDREGQTDRRTDGRGRR